MLFVACSSPPWSDLFLVWYAKAWYADGACPTATWQASAGSFVGKDVFFFFNVLIGFVVFFV